MEYFNGTWQKCRTGPDDMSLTRMTTLPFLLLALSPFVIFNSDNRAAADFCCFFFSKKTYSSITLKGIIDLNDLDN